jgi:transcriptional regulator with GAF, ATPase, and Fis domain
MFARGNVLTNRVPVDAAERTSTPDGGRPSLRSINSLAHQVPTVGDRMQRLLADFGLRCTTNEPEAIEAAIDRCLSDVGMALHVDQIAVWRSSPEGGAPRTCHSWNRLPDGSPADPSQLAAIPFIQSRLDTGAAAWFAGLDDITDQDDRHELLRLNIAAAVVLPIPLDTDGEDARGAVALASSTHYEWSSSLIEQVRLLSAVLALAITRSAILRALDHAQKVQRRQRVTEDRVVRRPTVTVLPTSRLIVSEGMAMRHALTQVEQVAPLPSTVLLLGETGVGKEVFAQAIHELSPRHPRPMVRVSCAAIPAALIESELFGRERGAFTGALSRQIGRFEAANQSTLFLDEIGDLPPEMQVKLLRVLQERVIERLGSTQPIRVDVRIIAATNRNLEQAVEERTFREDLFYRLNVFPITVPPLRERVEDIPALTWEFVNEFSRSMGKSIDSISTESMRQLQTYSWPGNVRELRNIIERAVIIAGSTHLTIPTPVASAGRQSPMTMTLRDVEIEHIRATLNSTHWRIRGHGGAAERLGLKPTTLETRMAKLGLTRPRDS